MNDLKVIRRAYLGRLHDGLSDAGALKVITGYRYGGKSTLARQFRDMLIEGGMSESGIIYLELDDPAVNITDSLQFSSAVRSRATRPGMVLIVDDMQIISDWQIPVKELREELGLNVYVVLPFADSGVYDEQLKAVGPYTVVNLFPLSFKEFLEMHPISDEHGYGERFEQFISIGGQPYAKCEIPQQDFFMIGQGWFNITINWDIGRRSRIDTAAICRLTNYIVNNIGKVVTLSALRKNSNVTDQRTVVKYLDYLHDYSFI